MATNDIGGIRHTLKSYFRLPLAASVPMTLVLFLFAEPLVSFIFERGVFTGPGAREVAQVQAMHVLQPSFYLLTPSSPDGDYWREGDLSSCEAVFRKNLSELDYVTVQKGWIPDTFAAVSECRFCFVHLDVDLYRPTVESLRFYYERTEERGLILCDDCRFVTCHGEAKAMDSFFADRREEIFSLPPGQGLVVKGWP